MTKSEEEQGSELCLAMAVTSCKAINASGDNQQSNFVCIRQIEKFGYLCFMNDQNYEED